MSCRTGLLAAVLVALAGAVNAGCGSACIAKGDRLVVDVKSSAELNDSGAGAQAVRFQVWAVKDKAMFDTAPAGKLAEADGVSTYERQGLGRVFVTESNFIKPDATRRLILSVGEDNEFTHVGISVAFPEARKAIVAVDCGDHPGYTEKSDKPEHVVTFDLGKQTVEPGGGAR